MSQPKRTSLYSAGGGRSGATSPKPPNSQRQSKIVSSLRATQIVQATETRAALPAELIELILDQLPVADLLRCARANTRLQEMVYDDARWVKKLQSMGCWDEGEARRRAEAMMKRRADPNSTRRAATGTRIALPGDGDGSVSPSAGRGAPPTITTTLFDAGFEEQKAVQRASLEKERQAEAVRQKRESLSNGFEAITLGTNAADSAGSPSYRDTQYALQALAKVRSIRGGARSEYGKVHGALAPFYFDVARSKTHADPVLFRTFRDPDQQAQILSQLRRFAQSDSADGWSHREERLETMIGIFEAAVLREFESGYMQHDYDGRMRQYAHVLVTLNGGGAGVDSFIRNHSLMLHKRELGDPLDCIRDAPIGGIAPGPLTDFFRRLSVKLVEQSAVIDRIFPPSTDVFTTFVQRIAEDVVGEYITTALDEAHARNKESYLKLVAALFTQSLQFANSLQPAQAPNPDLVENAREAVFRCFDAHVDLYLNEEIEYFKKKSNAEVTAWEKRLQDEAASAESFYMSNVSRQAAKNDFLSSFKKVVMMPVTVLPTIANPFVPATKTPMGGNTTTLTGGDSLEPGAFRSSTPVPGAGRTSPRLGADAPTTELAAKAALMSSRLAGISSLFSIEVALNLTHDAKASLDRTALFVRFGGSSGEEAREQCEFIFVAMLQLLGSRHIKTGFDRAVTHLSEYNPRAVAEHNFEGTSGKGVAPLVTFLELVNVGDLIMQMVDVFFHQELAANRLVDRDDFLAPAVVEKKRFEQMLDESVAAGLNKGIDVLIDEVEFLCSTMQPPGIGIYNPSAASAKGKELDIGPTEAATKIVDIVSSHTSMLVGSTDKHMLDVFNQEVGVRLFTALCKHIKRQRVSMDGAMKLISDTNHYYSYIITLKNKALTPYFAALRELAQIYLVDAKHYPKELATIIADGDKFYGIFRAEEVLEFAERRADWVEVRYKVERAMFGLGCVTM